MKRVDTSFCGWSKREYSCCCVGFCARIKTFASLPSILIDNTNSTYSTVKTSFYDFGRRNELLTKVCGLFPGDWRGWLGPFLRFRLSFSFHASFLGLGDFLCSNCRLSSNRCPACDTEDIKCLKERYFSRLEFVFFADSGEAFQPTTGSSLLFIIKTSPILLLLPFL